MTTQSSFLTKQENRLRLISALALTVTMSSCELPGPVDAGAGGGGASGGAGGGSDGPLVPDAGPRATGECSAPFPLDVSEGYTSVNVHGGSAPGNNSAGTCGGATGKDVVFSFTLTSRRKVGAWISNATGGAALYLRSGCDGAELACNAGQYGAEVETELDAGTYFVWVDGLGSLPVALSITVSGAGDTCAEPRALDFIDGSAEVFGPGAFAAPNFTSPVCQPAAKYADAVYTFTTTAPRRFTATTYPSSGSAIGHWLSLRSACVTSGPESACNHGVYAYDRPEVAVGNLPAGTWYLVAGGFGGFELRARLDQIAVAGGAESCATATGELRLMRGVNLATVGSIGQSSEIADDYACDSFRDEPDAVQKLVVPSSGAVSLHLVPTNPGGARVALALMGPNTSCAPAVTMRCANETSRNGEWLDFPSLAPGTYWVWVLGPAGTPYMLEARLD